LLICRSIDLGGTDAPPFLLFPSGRQVSNLFNCIAIELAYLSNMFIGLLLILLGGLFLLKSLGIVETSIWGLFGPLLMIVLGLSVILKPLRKKA